MKRLLLMPLFVLAACSPKHDKPSAPVAAAQASQVAEASAVAVAAAGQVLDCAMPAGPRTTAKEFAMRYGARAVAGDLPGPEGTTFRGVTLNGDSATDRLEINWWDKAQTAVSMVRVRDSGTGWTGPGGLRVGATLAQVEAANGKPFKISGFGWDYGGYVVDFGGGKLDKLPGGCSLSLRFDNPDFNGEIPGGISGDGAQVLSSDAKVRAYAPVVTEMSVGWALPAGMTPAE